MQFEEEEEIFVIYLCFLPMCLWVFVDVVGGILVISHVGQVVIYLSQTGNRIE